MLLVNQIRSGPVEPDLQGKSGPVETDQEIVLKKMSVIKTKNINVEPDIRVALSSTSPRIDYIVKNKMKQAHPSHKQ